MIWLWGLLTNVATGLVGWLLGWVHLRGFWAGLVAGTVIFAAFTWRGWLLLVGFFVLGSIATRVGIARKERLGIAQRRRGARGAREALANTATGLVLAGLSFFWPDAASDVMNAAFAGAFATALADTAASELGPLVGRRAFHPLTLRAAAPGAEGAISLEGTAVGGLAAAALAGVGLATGFLGLTALWAVPTAAVLASYVESAIGATVKRGILADNEVLNVLNTVVGASIAALIVDLMATGAAS